MDEALEALIDRLFDGNAFVMPPATDEEIAGLNAALEEAGYPKIPADYACLLKEANEIECRAFTLYGTGAYPPAVFDTTARNIAALTKRRMEAGADSAQLALGRIASGGLPVVHDGSSGRYQILDDSNDDVLYEYDAIAALMAEWMDKKKM